MKIVTIHPEAEADMTLPYPWMIDKEGLVLRQDFWRGKPSKLFGFQNEGDYANIPLTRKEFWECPKMAIGMFPVFLHSGVGVVTYFGGKIDRVSVENKGGL